MRFYYSLHALRVADKISTFRSIGTLRISCIVKENPFVFFLGGKKQATTGKKTEEYVKRVVTDSCRALQFVGNECVKIPLFNFQLSTN